MHQGRHQRSAGRARRAGHRGSARGKAGDHSPVEKPNCVEPQGTEQSPKQDGDRWNCEGFPEVATETTGWEPTCGCGAETRPCVVLDPFGGAGTVGLVADRLQRDAVLIEISPEYAEMARKRIQDDATLLAQVEVVAVTEKAFQEQVIQLAMLCGFLQYHTRDSRRSAAGFPDLILIRDESLIAAELKVGDQRDHARLNTTGSPPSASCPAATAVVWRPDAPPMAERWWRVETSEGADFGAIGRRLRG